MSESPSSKSGILPAIVVSLAVAVPVEIIKVFVSHAPHWVDAIIILLGVTCGIAFGFFKKNRVGKVVGWSSLSIAVALLVISFFAFGGAAERSASSSTNSVNGNGNSAIQGNNNISVQGNNNNVQSHDPPAAAPSTGKTNDQGQSRGNPSSYDQRSSGDVSDHLAAQGDGNVLNHGDGNNAIQAPIVNSIISSDKNFEQSPSISVTDNHAPVYVNYYAREALTNYLTNTVLVMTTQVVHDVQVVHDIDPVFIKFTNSLFQMLFADLAGNYRLSAIISSNSMASLDAARANGQWWAVHLDAHTESVVAITAAEAIDEQENNPETAFQFAKRAYDLIGSSSTNSFHNIFVIGEYANASANLGTWRLKQQRYQEAIDHYAIAIDIYKKQPDLLKGFYGKTDTNHNYVATWYTAQAYSYLQLGSNSQALRLAETAVENFPSDQTVKFLARVLHQLKGDSYFAVLLTTWYDVKMWNDPPSFSFRTNRAEVVEAKSNSLFLSIFANGIRFDLSDDRLVATEIPVTPAQLQSKACILIPVDSNATNEPFLCAIGASGQHATNFYIWIDTPRSLGTFPVGAPSMWNIFTNSPISFPEGHSIQFGIRVQEINPISDFNLEPFGIPLKSAHMDVPLIIQFGAENYAAKIISIQVAVERVPPGMIPNPPSLLFPTNGTFAIKLGDICHLSKSN
jgi:tetratricopeptide (TPR) repeat protein